MADNTGNKIIAFLFGDATVTVWLLGTQPFIHELGLFGVKIIVTLILGAVGGIGGIAGKELYTWYKAKRKRNKTNLEN